jgi:hypothetical protein
VEGQKRKEKTERNQKEGKKKKESDKRETDAQFKWEMGADSSR